MHRQPEMPAGADGSYVCKRIDAGSIIIDGQADEPVWRKAPAMTEFVTAGPRPQPAEAITRVRVLHDGQRLYFFFDCESPAFRIYGTERNDEIWKGEAAEIFLAPEGPDEPYYEINVNPAGVIFDSRILDWRYSVLSVHQRQWALEFDAGIERSVRQRKSADGAIVGWSVEIAIPFADLGYPEGPPPDAVWLFNVCRAAPLPDDRVEFSTWQSTGADFHRPHRFAKLVFE